MRKIYFRFLFEDSYLDKGHVLEFSVFFKKA